MRITPERIALIVSVARGTRGQHRSLNALGHGRRALGRGGAGAGAHVARCLAQASDQPQVARTAAIRGLREFRLRVRARA